MIGALLFAAVLFYAVLYSGLADLTGTHVGVWDALTGAVPEGGLQALTETSPTGSPAPIATGTAAGPNPMGQAIVAAARTLIGQPYRLGSAGPIYYDCSGLTQVAYARATGLRLPHNAAQQYAGTYPVLTPSPGDLAFYSIFRNLDHVGIVSGVSGSRVTMVIDSAPSHGGVSEHPPGINESHIIGYRRPGALVSQSTPGPHSHDHKRTTPPGRIRRQKKDRNRGR